MAGKMHADEVETDAALVRRLLAGQFPPWAELPIERVASAGTDNALYRLGDELAVRLPRIGWAAVHVGKECEWLPRLAPRLPLALPVPVAKGEPAEGYPFSWSVCRWLPGENATVERIGDQLQAALDLAQFVTALQRIDATAGPAAGRHISFRGMPLAIRDAQVRTAIASLDDMIDAGAASAAWKAALGVPEWRRAPVWFHGDLQSGNLLVVGSRLSAVIDFGCAGVGDPAVDMSVAWNLFAGEAREVYRAALAVDDATWARGRGWALCCALIALPYYRDTNPVLAAISRYAIEQVLADRERV